MCKTRLYWCPITEIVMLVEDNQDSLTVAQASSNVGLANLMGVAISTVGKAIKNNSRVAIPEKLRRRDDCKYGRIIVVDMID